mmetsp:Transcript_6171/g.15842  ORF Transcript_6171/g.15842 Transcript_6171/m.15842 type:complete len:243 (-) Transcript_6171:659-1387(-)
MALPPSGPSSFQCRFSVRSDLLKTRAVAIALPPMAPRFVHSRLRWVRLMLTASPLASAIPPATPRSFSLPSRCCSVELTASSLPKASATVASSKLSHTFSEVSWSFILSALVIAITVAGPRELNWRPSVVTPLLTASDPARDTTRSAPRLLCPSSSSLTELLTLIVSIIPSTKESTHPPQPRKVTEKSSAHRRTSATAEARVSLWQHVKSIDCRWGQCLAIVSTQSSVKVANSRILMHTNLG